MAKISDNLRAFIIREMPQRKEGDLFVAALSKEDHMLLMEEIAVTKPFERYESPLASLARPGTSMDIFIIGGLKVEIWKTTNSYSFLLRIAGWSVISRLEVASG